MPAGRPSDYKPEFCDEVVDYMGMGFSLSAFAGHIGQHRQRLYEWAERHPEFADAVKRAKMARVDFLEGELLTKKTGAEVTARIFALKNADPEEWRDRREVDMTSKGGSVAPLDWSKVPTEALEAIRAAMEKDGGKDGA